MIETPARVTRIDGPYAWVVSEAPASCQACAGKGCGSSVFNRLWHPQQAEYAVRNAIDAGPGEAVVVGMPEGSLLRAAVAAYVVPLLALLLGAGLGRALMTETLREPGAILGGLCGILLAALWLRYRRGPATEPVILRRGSTACASRA